MNFWGWKINLQQLWMHCQFWNYFSFRMVIFYFRSIPTASTKCVNLEWQNLSLFITNSSGDKITGRENTARKRFRVMYISVADPDNFAPDPGSDFQNSRSGNCLNLTPMWKKNHFFLCFSSFQSWYKITTRRSYYIRIEYCHITLF